MTWAPILDGDLAAAAKEALRDIAAQIGHHGALPEDLVLLWAYASSEDDAAARSVEAFERLVASVGARGGALHLHGGLAGIGWTLAHVGDPDDTEEFLATLDAAIVGALRGPGWAGDYDLIHGITGVGLYFLERLEGDRDAPLAREGLGHVVDYLAATATVERDGITWHTSASLLPTYQRELAPNGYYNCGVAHGVPGTIAMLARAATVADGPPRARELVERATRWLEARRAPGASGGFPSWVASGIERRTETTAWCYGDPGIATVLWSAADRLGAPVEPWRVLALECTKRAAARTGIRDACLCHGAFGLAHLFNRCFQASGDLLFRDAARSWIERGLAMRRPGEGVAGFSKYQPEAGSHPWIATDAFLDGVAGMGLVLAAALGDVEPSWDRLLAIDIPPLDRAP